MPPSCQRKTEPTHVETIRQAFSYVNQFRDRLFVIKIDDSLFPHHFFPLLVRDIALLHRMGIRIALVPGARLHIDNLLRRFGIRWTTHRGVRISPARGMRYIKLAASEVASRLMTALAEHGTTAVVGNWVRARAIGVCDGIDYQCSGTVESVRSDVVRRVLDDTVIPIIGTIGWSARGTAYNISADQLAVTVSRELHAVKLFFLTGREALSARDLCSPAPIRTNDRGILSDLTLDEARALLNANRRYAHRHDLELLARAVEACAGGVARVHIVDGRIDGALLEETFSSRGVGTMVYANEHANIRPMTKADIPDMLRIMQPAVEAGLLLPRSAEYIDQHTADFVVYDVDGTVHGCAALHVLGGRQAEIAALAVDDVYTKLGIGKRLVSFLIERARTLGIRRVFALTTRSADWFAKLGFRPARPADLPPTRRASYDRRRRSRVLVFDVPAERQPVRAAVE